MGAQRWRKNRPNTELEKVNAKRRRAYRKEIEGLKGLERIDENSGMGFVLDAVLGQLGAAIQAGEITATPEMTELLTRIQAVKAAHPKP